MVGKPERPTLPPTIRFEPYINGIPMMIRCFTDAGDVERSYGFFMLDENTGVTFLFHIETTDRGGASAVLSAAKQRFPTILAAATNGAFDSFLRSQGFVTVMGEATGGEPVLGWRNEGWDEEAQDE